MSDLFNAPPPSRDSRPSSGVEKPTSSTTRAEIVARYGVADVKSPRAHLCFRCGVSTGIAYGFLHRGEKIVFACEAHFGELTR